MERAACWAPFEKQWAQGKFVSVGLDTSPDEIAFFKGTRIQYNREIVRATRDHTCAYKPNFAFYEAQGSAGIRELEAVVDDIRYESPDTPIILDCKRGDIGDTNSHTATMIRNLGVHAVTISPYLGQTALQPFLDCGNLAVLVLCANSNQGAEEFQDVVMTNPDTKEQCTLHEYVAYRVSAYWNVNGNCGLVVGATKIEKLERIRTIVPDMPLLIPGIGKQGGDLDGTVRLGMDTTMAGGMVINSSSGIIYARPTRVFADGARDALMSLNSQIAALQRQHFGDATHTLSEVR